MKFGIQNLKYENDFFNKKYEINKLDYIAESIKLESEMKNFEDLHSAFVSYTDCFNDLVKIKDIYSSKKIESDLEADIHSKQMEIDIQSTLSKVCGSLYSTRFTKSSVMSKKQESDFKRRGMVGYQYKLEGVGDFIATIFEKIKAFVAKIWEFIVGFFKKIGDVILGGLDRLRDIRTKLEAKFENDIKLEGSEHYKIGKDRIYVSYGLAFYCGVFKGDFVFKALEEGIDERLEIIEKLRDIESETEETIEKMPHENFIKSKRHDFKAGEKHYNPNFVPHNGTSMTPGHLLHRFNFKSSKRADMEFLLEKRNVHSTLDHDDITDLDNRVVCGVDEDKGVACLFPSGELGFSLDYMIPGYKTRDTYLKMSNSDKREWLLDFCEESEYFLDALKEKHLPKLEKELEKTDKILKKFFREYGTGTIYHSFEKGEFMNNRHPVTNNAIEKMKGKKEKIANGELSDLGVDPRFTLKYAIQFAKLGSRTFASLSKSIAILGNQSKVIPQVAEEAYDILTHESPTQAMIYRSQKALERWLHSTGKK